MLCNFNFAIEFFVGFFLLFFLFIFFFQTFFNIFSTESAEGDLFDYIDMVGF